MPDKIVKVWVLVRRYEWEAQSNQTKYCDTFVFGKKADALLKAETLCRTDMRRHGFPAENVRTELDELRTDLGNREFPIHLTQLTDADNVVFELYRKAVR